MTAVSVVVLAVRFLLELAALAALGYWGFHLDKPLLARIALGLGTPLAAAVLWGTFIAPKAALPVPLAVRLPLELAVFGAAAAALYASGHPRLAVAFLAAAVVDSALNVALKL
ncbi:YrdB family protein [Paenibacillus flagellatus]|uniref:DUF2568 domain-containing protein n=1 Tax=Paenibacillus flagellatus TaxID=2211139 RepID=A0A2V5JWH7_9BACL|nr:YrdB family protein [Paenibacillus flagellatus]PYI50542.1 hypothetical protein DLM86_29005 [Paenibacillus flagellatus]